VRKLVLLALFVLALAAGCGGDDDGDEAAAPTTTASCEKHQLELVEAGRLTIGTDNPAFPPWFEGGTPEGSQWEINDPATGEGFESAGQFPSVGGQEHFGRLFEESRCATASTRRWPATDAAVPPANRRRGPPLDRGGTCGILGCRGEVAEWLKAAPC
jgi:hypothetical protein